MRDLHPPQVLDGLKHKMRVIGSVDPDGSIVLWKKMKDGSVVSADGSSDGLCVPTGAHL